MPPLSLSMGCDALAIGPCGEAGTHSPSKSPGGRFTFGGVFPRLFRRREALEELLKEEVVALHPLALGAALAARGGATCLPSLFGVGLGCIGCIVASVIPTSVFSRGG